MMSAHIVETSVNRLIKQQNGNVAVDSGKHIKNTQKIVKIDLRPDYSACSHILKWRSCFVAKSALCHPKQPLSGLHSPGWS